MREKTIDAVTQLLGQPSSATDKVLRWYVRPGLDVVVQQDGSSSRGVVWMPWPCCDGACPSNGEVFEEGQGRHSNTYGAPSLARGKAAIKLTVTSAKSLSSVLEMLKTAATIGQVRAVNAVAQVPPMPPLQPAMKASVSVVEQPKDQVTALVIKLPWIDLVLQGRKTWEIRGSHTKTRGRIALIKSKSGCVMGTCRVVDCIGPLSMDQMRANAEKHQIPLERLDHDWPYDKTYAWVLTEPQPLDNPISYKHPSGAVIWVRLTPQNVRDRFDELVAAIR